MLGSTYVIIPANDAKVAIMFMKRGHVLAVATAYDDEHAAVTARILLFTLTQFDSVLIVPFSRNEQRPHRHPSKAARREIKRAYLDGLLEAREKREDDNFYGFNGHPF